MQQTFSELFQPERIRDRVSVDEGDGVALRLPDPEVPAGPPRPVEHVQVDEVVALFVSANDVAGRVLAERVDHNHFEGRLLDDEAVEKRCDVPLFVANCRDDADEQRGS